MYENQGFGSCTLYKYEFVYSEALTWKHREPQVYDRKTAIAGSHRGLLCESHALFERGLQAHLEESFLTYDTFSFLEDDPQSPLPWFVPLDRDSSVQAELSKLVTSILSRS